MEGMMEGRMEGGRERGKSVGLKGRVVVRWRVREG